MKLAAAAYGSVRCSEFRAQACPSKVSCAMRLKASAATVLSKCGETTPQGQCEQHQPVKFSSSAQIMRRVICTPTVGCGIRRKDGLPEARRAAETAKVERDMNCCLLPHSLSHGTRLLQSDKSASPSRTMTFAAGPEFCLADAADLS